MKLGTIILQLNILIIFSASANVTVRTSDKYVMSVIQHIHLWEITRNLSKAHETRESL